MLARSASLALVLLGRAGSKALLHLGDSADGASRFNALRTMMPQPGGFVTASNGSLWFFPARYRDSQGGTPLSNFTDGIAVQFN